MTSNATSTFATDTISTLTYDQRFYTVLGVAVTLIVLSSLWIVTILVSIEASKANFFSMTDNSLEMTVDEYDDGVDHERRRPNSPKSASSPPPPTRGRRVRLSFKAMQLASVSVLLLLTYLLLVVSDAPLWASALGSLCVFGMFLRFQIGEELRRQRLDRITLMLSLFLFIASLMSVCTYAFRSLGNGEIYEGPARIVGYDQEAYNNTDHDPSTRMDLEVQWGHSWGCPMSGGKVCQAAVQGAMCTVNLEPENRRRRQQRRVQQQTTNHPHGRRLQQQQQQAAADVSSEPTLQPTAKVDLAAENAELEQENQQLEQEVEELELAKEETEELATEEVDVVEEEKTEEEALYGEEIETIEEEELEIEEVFTDAYIDVEKEKVEVEEQYADDPEKVAEDEETIQELEDEEEEIDETYEEYENEYQQNAEDFEKDAEVAGEKEVEINDEEGATKEKYDEAIVAVAEGSTTEGQDEALQEAAQETIDTALADGDQEATEGEDMDWYWDELTYEYDDDMFETGYWDYDWDSVWGEYACEDLFDGDAAGLSYDPSIEAGTDGYPYVNIYGSCKTCEAYVLDYFAEQAFESVEDHKKMASVYMSGAMFGFFISFLLFITFKIRPQAENEIELLDSNSGVMA